jgi:hypothetical protein
MIVKIQKCFETAIGTIVIFDTPVDFVPETNMRINNGQDEVWEVKAISFNEYKADDECENIINDDTTVYRSYQIIEIKSKRNKSIKLQEYFAKYTWSIS